MKSLNLNDQAMILDHQNRINALEKSLDKLGDLGTNMAVIKETVSNMDKNLNTLVSGFNKIDDRVTKNENDIGKQGERIGIVAGIQTIVTVLISTVVAFVKKG